MATEWHLLYRKYTSQNFARTEIWASETYMPSLNFLGTFWWRGSAGSEFWILQCSLFYQPFARKRWRTATVIFIRLWSSEADTEDLCSAFERLSAMFNTILPSSPPKKSNVSICFSTPMWARISQSSHSLFLWLEPMFVPMLHNSLIWKSKWCSNSPTSTT